jgi:YD repeat-containing protein
VPIPAISGPQPGVDDAFAYNGTSHTPTSFTDADGGTWNFTQNAAGQITSVQAPGPTGTSTITYGSGSTAGLPVAATDGNGNLVTVDSYDALGDPTSVSTYPSGPAGAPESSLFWYDAAQRLTLAQSPNGAQTQYFYAGDHLDHVIDPAGNQWQFSYCPSCGALSGVLGPLGWSLGVSYDMEHQVQSFTDANGNATTYNYGQAGELDSVAMPDGTGSSAQYTVAGQVSQVTNGRGDLINYSYDALERLTEIDFPTSGNPSIYYAYNDDDTLKSFTDGVGTTAFTYTPEGRVASVVYDYSASGLSPAQEIDYTYNLDGSRESMAWKNGTQTLTWTYNYDPGGRLTSLTNPFNETTSWTYDGEDKVTSQTDQNNTSVAYGYDPQTGWLTSVLYNVNGIPCGFPSLTYDLRHEVARMIVAQAAA